MMPLSRLLFSLLAWQIIAAPVAIDLYETAHEHQTRGDAIEALQLYELAATAFKKEAKAATERTQRSAKRKARSICLLRLGNVQLQLRRFDEAVDSYRRVLKMRPDYSNAWVNRAIALKDVQRKEEAFVHASHAIELNPLSVQAYQLQGELLMKAGTHEQATMVFSKTVELEPANANHFTNLGGALDEAGSKSEAAEMYKRALELNPMHSLAFCNMIISKRTNCDWSRFPDEFSQLRRILQQQLAAGSKPCVTPFHALMLPLTAAETLAIAASFARNAVADAQFLHRSLTLDSAIHQKPPVPRTPRLRIGYISSDFRESPTGFLLRPLFGEHGHDRRRVEVYCYSLVAAPQCPVQAAIRSGVNKQMQRNASEEDGGGEEVGGGEEDLHFVDVSGLTVRQIVDRIRADHVDVLVEVNGWVQGSLVQVLAAQPAPVQVSFLAFPGTTGASYIQYLVSDHVVTPPSGSGGGSLSDAYSEKIGFIGGHGAARAHYQLNDYRTHYPHRLLHRPSHTSIDEAPPSAVERAIARLDTIQGLQLPPRVLRSFARGHNREHGKYRYGKSSSRGTMPTMVVLANFNTLYKIDPSTFLLWNNIMRRTAHSVFWLTVPPPPPTSRQPQGGKDSSNASSSEGIDRSASGVEANLVAEAAAAGVNPRRLVFSPRLRRPEHLQRCAVPDLFVDSLSVNAHSTAADVLWSGTPVVTVVGEKMAGRLATGLLHALDGGLPGDLSKLCALHSQKELEDFVVYLASNRTRLAVLRERFERQRVATATRSAESVLCRTKLGARAQGRAGLFNMGPWVQRLERLLHLASEVRAATGESSLHIWPAG
jgi:protein O-GlcNAc transferase